MGMGNEGSGAGWGFDTSFGRVVRGACAAWSRSKPLSLLIGLAPVAALALGCAAAAKVHAALANAPAAQSAVDGGANENRQADQDMPSNDYLDGLITRLDATLNEDGHLL